LFLAATAFAALGPVLAALALTGGGTGGAARSALALWALAGALAVLAMASKK
jgi:hypothetical protein